MASDQCIMVLGGAGLVGSQVVREISRELEPERIVVASLFRGEVREFLHDIRREFPQVKFEGAWGDVFVRDEFSMERRRRLLMSRVYRDKLYDDLFGDINDTYERSSLVQLILRFRPDVLVDCINTATAISYQDVESLSKQTHDILKEVRMAVDHQDLKGLDRFAHLPIDGAIDPPRSSLTPGHVRGWHPALFEDRHDRHRRYGLEYPLYP
jgi:hypothetical protein